MSQILSTYPGAGLVLLIVLAAMTLHQCAPEEPTQINTKAGDHAAYYAGV